MRGRVLLLCLIAAAGACEGAIEADGAERRSRGAGSGALGDVPPGPQGVGPGGTPDPGVAADEARAADEAMRADNPDLFALAERYFPGQVPQAGTKRLARLTRSQLDATTASLLPGAYSTTAVETVPRDPLQTNYEYSENLGFNAANFTPYTTWVRAMADEVAADPSAIVGCGANDAACLDAAARSFVMRAFRGVASEAQLTRFSQFYSASVAEVGLEQATGDLVDVALTSPGYVFRDEVQTDAAGYLLPAQRLQHLTYTLADGPPQSVGLAFAEAQQLVGTPQALAQTVEQVLATPQARQKLMQFFISWLEVREPAEFDIAADVFPEFTPEVAQAMVEETRAFLDHQLTVAAPRLKDVTQSTESFVSDALGFIYGQRRGFGGGGEPVALDPDQRLGIFTLPGVIASHSGPTTTRLVKRGVFFTRKIMCLPLGVPPEDVDTTVPDTPNATERQRIESVTNQPRCQGCHAFINPFGFMQENYDPIGRWRTTDEGLPIDPSISIDFLDEGPLTTDSPVEALRTLTGSMRFQQCFARQLFRFYMGRNEKVGDDPLLRQMFFQFANQDQQDIVDMLRTLAGSSSFSQRSEAP